MSEPNVRASTDADIEAISEIYGHHVLHGTASFETVAPETGAIADRRQAVLDHGLPYLVAELDGLIAGFAYAGTYRPRPAYRFTVENSVYIRPGLERRGLGRLLMTDVLRRCEDGPWRQMIAVIGDGANESSIRLHDVLGFQHVGVLRSVGFKFGRWLDTVVMQRALNAGAASAPDSFYRA